MIDKIFVFGASNTDSMWWTWKNFLEIESNISTKDLSVRGVGNTYMINSLIDQPLNENSLVVGMFTNVDKFDWYVEGERYRRLCREKHKPIPVGSDSGFWCTGSWFPLEKQQYLEQFYSLDYFTAQTIQQIYTLTHLCSVKQCQVEIFFDSPIWNYTEQDLNQMITLSQNLPSRQLLDMPLSKKWIGLLNSNLIDLSDTSLIGYCWQNNLPWGSTFYKGHPPCSSHWQFYQKIVRPRLSKHLKLGSATALDQKINEMDLLWKNC